MKVCVCVRFFGMTTDNNQENNISSHPPLKFYLLFFVCFPGELRRSPSGSRMAHNFFFSLSFPAQSVQKPYAKKKNAAWYDWGNQCCEARNYWNVVYSSFATCWDACGTLNEFLTPQCAAHMRCDNRRPWILRKTEHDRTGRYRAPRHTLLRFWLLLLTFLNAP